jgi:tetratricopeptide (TPR) repeat protein
MEHKTHSEQCACGHGHERHSMSIAVRWLISLFIVTGFLFLLRPFLAQQMLMRAASYFSCSSYDEVVRICKKIVMIEANNLRAWTSLGYAYKEKGDIDAAIKAYERAFALNPRDRRSAFDLGMAYFLKNDYQRVLTYLELIRKQGPEKDNSLTIDIPNYHRSALTMLKECYKQLGNSVKVKIIEDEIKKYYPNASKAARSVGLNENK